MIIDVHNHVGASEDGGHGKLDVLLENMEKFHIVKSVVFATDEPNRGSTYQNINPKIIKIQNDHPDKIIAFARIVPSAKEEAVEEFRVCIESGVHGLKLKPPDGFEPPEARIIFEIMKDIEHFPVIIHTAHNQHSLPRLWEHFFLMNIQRLILF